MEITAELIRSRNDRQLFEALLKNPDVIRVNEALERLEKQGPTGTRRHLLATSVRLNRSMAPEVHAIKDCCVERLGIDIPLELFVYNSPTFNAACVKPEEGRLFILFSSSLLEAFRDNELAFVMGHELGHHVYRHHDIPIGHMLRGTTSPGPRLALQLFAWSRYAEISADRAGAYCADNPTSVARALFRLASGLSDAVVQFDADAFLRQVDDLQIAGADVSQSLPREDWFLTHPFSPMRVKALKLFHDSVFSDPRGIDIEELELGVQTIMALMEPSYMDGRTPADESLRRLLFAGAIAIARADGEISADEAKVFEELFGKGAFSERLDIDQIMYELPQRIRQARENASVTKLMQVLRDLCLMLKASGDDHDAAREVIYDIAEALNISPLFVDSRLEELVELD
jgi:hypothetical protein